VSPEIFLGSPTAAIYLIEFWTHFQVSCQLAAAFVLDILLIASQENRKMIQITIINKVAFPFAKMNCLHARNFPRNEREMGKTERKRVLKRIKGQDFGH